MIPAGAIDLDLTPALVDAIKSGARVVSGYNASPVAQYGLQQVAALCLEIGQRPPILAVPAFDERWLSPLPPMMSALLEAKHLSLVKVPIPHRSLIDLAGMSWDDRLAKFANMESFAIQSPWPSFIRQGCSQTLGKIPLVRFLARSERTTPTILLEFGPRSGRAPDQLYPGIISAWNPFSHLASDDVAGRLIAAGADLDRRSCSMCVACPVYGAKPMLAALSTADSEILADIMDLESRSTFPFTERGCLIDQIASDRLTPELSELGEIVRERAAAREALEVLMAKKFRSETLEGIRAMPSATELVDLALYREAVSDLLHVPIKHTSAGAVAQRIRSALASRRPVPLSELLSGGGTMH